MTNLERLALLLQRVTGVEAGKTPEETIKRAVQEIKASKNTDQQVKSQLSKVKLSEEEMYGGAEELPTLTDYVRNKFAGEPSTKSWKAIELANIGRIDDLKKRQLYKKKFTDYTEDADINIDPKELEDNDFDFENGIDFKSIDAFMNNLSDADYLEIYGNDDLDFSEFDDVDPSEIETTAVAELKECEEIISTSFNAAELMEALSVQARIRRKIKLRQIMPKIKLGRERAEKRRATMDKLRERARRAAILMLKQKYAHKAIADMSIADKERVEKILQTKKALLNRLTMKMIRNARENEQKRFKNKEEK